MHEWIWFIKNYQSPLFPFPFCPRRPVASVSIGLDQTQLCLQSSFDLLNKNHGWKSIALRIYGRITIIRWKEISPTCKIRFGTFWQSFGLFSSFFFFFNNRTAYLISRCIFFVDFFSVSFWEPRYSTRRKRKECFIIKKKSKPIAFWIARHSLRKPVIWSRYLKTCNYVQTQPHRGQSQGRNYTTGKISCSLCRLARLSLRWRAVNHPVWTFGCFLLGFFFVLILLSCFSRMLRQIRYVNIISINFMASENKKSESWTNSEDGRAAASFSWIADKARVESHSTVHDRLLHLNVSHAQKANLFNLLRNAKDNVE